MFQSYPDIVYDDKTRRINRIMKIIFIPVLLIIVGGIAAAASQVDVTTGPKVINDTQGSVTCLRATLQQRSETLNLSLEAHLEPGDEARVSRSSTCSVFNRSGDYVGCLIVRRDADKDVALRASDATRGVKAETCAYPR